MDEEEKCVCDCDCEQSEETPYIVDYDEEKFNQGIDDASYFAGFYMTLRAAGVPDKEAVEFMNTKMLSDYNMKIIQIEGKKKEVEL